MLTNILNAKMQNETNEEKSTKKRKSNSKNPNSNLGDWWILRKFRSRQDLEQFALDKNFKPRSKENKSCYQGCRFCQAINPQISHHMIQIYYDCNDCFIKKNRKVTNGPNCTKSNICEDLKKYELLTCHNAEDLSLDVNISDLGEPFTAEIESNDLDDLIVSIDSLNISRKEKYQKMKDEFYYWTVDEYYHNPSSPEAILIKNSKLRKEKVKIKKF